MNRNRRGAVLAIHVFGIMGFGVPFGAEAQERSTGLAFLDDATYRSIPLAATPLLGNLPDAVDLSAKFPTPGQQGQQASCVGWATAYALKSFQEGSERHWDVNENAMSPSFIYNQINRSADCKGGTTFVDAMNVLRSQGVAPMSLFPYDERSCNALPSPAAKQAAKQYAIADWRRVNPQDEIEIKTQVASGFPVMIGMEVDDSFQSLRPGMTYTGPDGTRGGGHAMVVVGYDNARASFRLINSWGTDWGDNGFAWITYSAFRATVREAYVAQDIVLSPTPAPAPTPVPPPTIHPQPDRDQTPSPPAFAQATIHQPIYYHNLLVPSPSGPVPGMRINVPGSIKNAMGKTVQIVVKFSYFNGPPLFAHAQEMTFRDTGGFVATGTVARVLGSNNETIGHEDITIPYYALNFMATNGMNQYNLAFVAMIYVDNMVAAQSAPVPFSIRW